LSCHCLVLSGDVWSCFGCDMPGDESLGKQAKKLLKKFKKLLKNFPPEEEVHKEKEKKFPSEEEVHKEKVKKVFTCSMFVLVILLVLA
jgi:hypothetical protein